jgi:hypothetical protein
VISGGAFGMVASVEGLADLEQQVAQSLASRLGETVEIAVVAGGKRGAVKNALIARAQANQRRNPFYLNKRAMQAIRFLVNGAVSSVASVRASAHKAIADEMLVSIGENAQAQRNPGGDGFKPLSQGYALRKQRAVGFVLPILKRSGDLLGGLRTRINRFLSR